LTGLGRRSPRRQRRSWRADRIGQPEEVRAKDQALLLLLAAPGSRSTKLSHLDEDGVDVGPLRVQHGAGDGQLADPNQVQEGLDGEPFGAQLGVDRVTALALFGHRQQLGDRPEGSGDLVEPGLLGLLRLARGVQRRQVSRQVILAGFP